MTHQLSREIQKYFILILHKKEGGGLDSHAFSLPPLSILPFPSPSFMPFFGFLFLSISPLYWSQSLMSPLRPPSTSSALSASLQTFPFFSPGSPLLHFWRGGNEIFKAVLLLRPIFRWDRATPLSLCLCVCVCVCVLTCTPRSSDCSTPTILCQDSRADTLRLSHTNSAKSMRQSGHPKVLTIRSTLCCWLQ